MKFKPSLGRRLSCAFFIALLSACGGGDDSNETTRPSQPPPEVPTAFVWEHAQSFSNQLLNGEGDVLDLASAHNAQGEVLLAWAQKMSSGEMRLYVSEFSDGVWTHPSGLNDFKYSSLQAQPNGSLNVDLISDVQVALSKNGEALVAWKEDFGSSNRIFFIEKRGGYWLSPTEVQNSPSYTLGFKADSPRLGINDEGFSVLAWVQDLNPRRLFRSVYEGGAWTHPASSNDAVSPEPPLDNPTDYYAVKSLELSVNSGGEAVLVWSQEFYGAQQIFVSQLVGGQWADPLYNDYKGLTDVDLQAFPKVELNDEGDALLAWVGFDGNLEQAHVLKAEYSSSSGLWTWPADLTEALMQTNDPYGVNIVDVAFNNAGKGVVAWVDSGANTYNQLFISTNLSGAWVSPADSSDSISPPETAVLRGSDFVSVSVGGNDRAVISWMQKDSNGQDHVFYSEHFEGEWRHPETSADHISLGYAGGGLVSPVCGVSESEGAYIFFAQPAENDVVQMFKSESLVKKPITQGQSLKLL